VHAEDSQRPKGSTAHLACAQAAAIGADSPDQIFVLPAQLFLPDRKNGLASMVALFEHPDRFFAHLIGRHRSTSSLDR
jgi:hypothetical protein